MTLTPMLKSRCLMFSVHSDQVYSELGAVGTESRPACTSEPLLCSLFRGNNLRNIRRF